MKTAFNTTIYIVINNLFRIEQPWKKQTMFFISKIFTICILAAMLANCNKDSDDPVKPPPPAPAKPMAWAVGQQDSTAHAMILFSADSGSTWVRQGVNSTALQGVDASDLFVVDTNNVWVVCTNNTIVKTTDGGDSWSKVNSPPVGTDVAYSSISIVDNSDIWISGAGINNKGIVCKSTDEGESWTVFDTSYFSGFLMQGIWAINSQIIYTVGNNAFGNWHGFIARTLDGGLTWDSISLGDNYNKYVGWIGVQATDENHLVIHGGNGHYSYTTNGGQTWNNDSIYGGGAVGLDINDLIMLDETTWWSACDFDKISITYDSGLTWTPQESDPPSNMFLLGIDAYNNQLALITGGSAGLPLGGKIMQTTDGGNTWVTKYLTTNALWKVAFAPH